MANKAFDLTGKTFGKWNVISFYEKSKHGHIIWRCICACGKEGRVRTNLLIKGHSTSCGCAKSEEMMNRMLGTIFCRLTVISHERVDSRNKHWWLCRCECGADVIARTDHLDEKRVRSCGCLNRKITATRNFRHGLRYTVEYHLWDAIIQRCCNPNNDRYADYGGRGITIHPQWRNDFIAFLRDVGRRPDKSLSIDRIDNSKGYEPGNVRWATAVQQANNRRPKRKKSDQDPLTSE